MTCRPDPELVQREQKTRQKHKHTHTHIKRSETQVSTSDLKSRVRVTRKTGDDNIFKLVEGEK